MNKNTDIDWVNGDGFVITGEHRLGTFSVLRVKSSDAYIAYFTNKDNSRKEWVVEPENAVKLCYINDICEKHLSDILERMSGKHFTDGYGLLEIDDIIETATNEISKIRNVPDQNRISEIGINYVRLRIFYESVLELCHRMKDLES